MECGSTNLLINVNLIVRLLYFASFNNKLFADNKICVKVPMQGLIYLSGSVWIGLLGLGGWVRLICLVKYICMLSTLLHYLSLIVIISLVYELICLSLCRQHV